MKNQSVALFRQATPQQVRMKRRIWRPRAALHRCGDALSQQADRAEHKELQCRRSCGVDELREDGSEQHEGLGFVAPSRNSCMIKGHHRKDVWP